MSCQHGEKQFNGFGFVDISSVLQLLQMLLSYRKAREVFNIRVRVIQ